MYKLKKIFALVLAVALATSFSTVAFAAEESGIPENATQHTIEVTVEPGETFDGSEEGIAPYIWGQETYPTNYDGVTYTKQFTIPNRYFAYEAVATSNGSGNCLIALMLSNCTTEITNLVLNVNGAPQKNDWIDVSANTVHLFRITNRATDTITVTITYYSWA